MDAESIVNILKTGSIGLALLLMFLCYRLLIPVINDKNNTDSINKEKIDLLKFFIKILFSIIVIFILTELFSKVYVPTIKVKVNLNPDTIDDFTFKIGSKPLTLSEIGKIDGIKLENNSVIYLDLSQLKNKVNSYGNQIKVEKEAELTKKINNNEESNNNEEGI